MPKLTKRQKLAAEKVQPGKVYPIKEALKLIKACATKKFKESVEVAINLNVDSRKSDQSVRGATILPYGTGKNVRVAVFTQGDQANKAKEAGADIVGTDDLVAQIQFGNINFDLVIATPETMRIVGKLAQILGPRGLMPNLKDGTVTADVATAVKNAKLGQVRYRTDKNGIIHCAIGKVDFEEKALEENLLVLLSDIKRSKPSFFKGTYLKKLTISSTMGPGIIVGRPDFTIG